MFDYFNKPALDDAIKNNKIIRFSHNPESYGECALKWEWDYLQEQHSHNCYTDVNFDEYLEKVNDNLKLRIPDKYLAAHGWL